MNEQSVEERIRTIAAQTPPDAFPFDSVLRRGRAARRRRSTLRIAGAVALLIVAAGSLPVVQHLRTPPPVPPAAVPSTLTLTCDGSRATVDTTTVAARADGVHIVVNRGPGSTFFHFEDPRGFGPGSVGGDVLWDVRQQHVLTPPPGPLEIGCAQGEESGVRLRVEIVDPEGFYRPWTFCPRFFPSLKDYVTAVPPGATKEEAVANFLRERYPGRTDLTVRSAGVGYVAENPETYVVRDGSKVVEVVQMRAESGSFKADTYGSCGPV